MKTVKKTLTIFLSNIFVIANVYASALPQNISELVENTAPAVVNITSKKEMANKTGKKNRFFKTTGELLK